MIAGRCTPRLIHANSHPSIKVISTFPSTLGHKEFHLVLFDSKKHSAIVIDNPYKQNEIGDSLYPTAEYDEIFAIHSTSSRGEKIQPLAFKKSELNHNRVNCDSIVLYHYLGTKIEGSRMLIRTGFHDVLQSSQIEVNKHIMKWDFMNLISNGYKEITVDLNKFRCAYNDALRSLPSE